MPKITLKEPWTYRTPEKTIRYPAGEHTVYKYIAGQAEADGVIEEKANGDSGSNAGSQGGSDAPEE